MVGSIRYMKRRERCETRWWSNTKKLSNFFTISAFVFKYPLLAKRVITIQSTIRKIRVALRAERERDDVHRVRGNM